MREHQNDRRTFLKSVGATTAGIALAGCLNTGGSTTLQARHFATPGTETFLQEHTEAFEEETGIAVEFEMMDWGNALSTQLSSMSSQSGPDVGEIASTWIPQQVAADGWMDMNEAGVELDQSSLYEEPTNIGHFDGKFVGLPWFWGPRGHVMHKQMHRDAGLDGAPADWDELVEFGSDFRDTHGDAHLLGLPNATNISHFFADFLWQNNGELLSDDHSEVLFNSDAGVEGMNFYISLLVEHDTMPRGSAEWAAEDRDSAFIDQRIGSTWASLGAVNALLDDSDTTVDDLEISQLPAAPGGRSAVFFGLDLVGIHPWTDKQEEAAQWIEYLARPEVNADIAKETGFLPTVKASFDSIDNELYQKYQDLLPTAKTFPQVQGWGQVEQIINDAVSGLVNDAVSGNWSEGDTQEALDQAAQEAQAALDDA